MPKYTVGFTGEGFYEVNVEAENETAAIEIAERMLEPIPRSIGFMVGTGILISFMKSSHRRA